MVNYSYFFLLLIFYEQVNLTVDYFIFLSFISFLFLWIFFLKKINFNNILFLLVISSFIDFLSFNYLFSSFFIILGFFIIFKKFIDEYKLSKIFKLILIALISSVYLFIIRGDFYHRLNIIEVAIPIIIIIFINFYLLRLNVSKI